MTGYLELVPRKLSLLLSAYRMTAMGERWWRTSRLALTKGIFLDSGTISLLKLAEKGKATPEDVLHWVADQDKLTVLAERVAMCGVRPPTVVAMMDHPCEPWLLERVGTTVKNAVDVTIRNALTWRTAELLFLCKRVYVAQGWTLDDYANCMDAYEVAGILDDIRKGDAWLAAGTTCMREPPGLYSVYDFLRRRLGPEGHMHALGIARPEWVAHMWHRGWIQSADSATASVSVGFNRGVYSVAGKRPQYLVKALFAAQMEHLEAEIMEQVTAKPRSQGQHTLFDRLEGLA